MHTVAISQDTFSRLQKNAVPLVDSIETVINRALDALEVGGATTNATASLIRTFNPESPPSLSFTTVRSVVFEGIRHTPSETYWNSILMNAVRHAAKKGLSPKQISELIIVNHVDGEKNDVGYKYIDVAGVSVQGQDANAAWKAAYHLAINLDLSIEVTFFWQDNPKAAFPGQSGSFSVNAKD